MSITDRIKQRRARQAASDIQPSDPVQQPVSSVPADEAAVAPATIQSPVPLAPKPAPAENTGLQDTTNQMVKDVTKQPVNIQGTQGADWRTMNWGDAAKYNPQLTRSEYLGGVEQYRKDNGMAPLSYGEIAAVLQNKDPFISAADEEKRKKRLVAAERVNAIGTVLANLLNVTRTQNGNPAMQINPEELGETKINRMRDWYYKEGNNNYANYYTSLAKDRAARAAAEAADLEYERKLAIEAAKQNSPLNRARLENEGRRGTLLDAQAEEQRLKNKNLPQEQEDRHRLSVARQSQAYAAAAKSKSDTNRKFINLSMKDGKQRRYSPDSDGADWVHAAYIEMLKQAGDNAKNYTVNKGLMGNELPDVNDMYNMIAKYNNDQWANQYKTNRYKKNEKAPLE